MMKRYISAYLFLLTAALLPSCNRSDICHVDLSGFESAELQAEGGHAVHGDPISCIVLRDSMVVEVFQAGSGVPLLCVSDLFGHSQPEYLEYGSNGGKLLSAALSYNEDILMINDFIKHEIHSISIGDLPHISENVTSVITDITSKFILPYGNGCVFLNQFSRGQDEPRLLFTDSGYFASQEQELFDTYNVVSGFIATDEESGIFAYVDGNNPVIEFSRRDGLIKTLDFGKFVEIRYSDFKSGPYTIRAFSDYYPNSFTACCHDRNAIYAVLDPSAQYPDGRTEYASDFATLLRLDWEGNIVCTYTFPSGHRPRNISVSTDGKTLFSYERGETSSIVVYSL